MTRKITMSVAVALTALTFSLSQAAGYSVEYNQHGAILRNDSETVYLGTSCDAASSQYGSGSWRQGSTGLTVRFSDKSLEFPGWVIENKMGQRCMLGSANQQQRQGDSEATVRGGGTQEHQTCVEFGFVAGTSEYSNCQLEIHKVIREAKQLQEIFEERQQQYQARLAEYEKEKERQRGLALMRFGGALMSGTSPHFSENFANAGRDALGIAPVPPTRPNIHNFTIRHSSGRISNCSVINNHINCH